MPIISSLGAAASRGFGQFLQKITAALNDAYFKYVSLLLTGNPPVSTFVTDASTNNLQITINGDTKPNGFNPYVNGYYSFYSPTANDYFYYSDTSSGNFGTSDFTVEGWFYLTASAQNFIMASPSTSTWELLTYGDQLYWHENGGNYGGMGYGTVPKNQWVHLAVSRTGGFLNLYINGTRVLNSANSYNYSGISTRYIGPSSGGTNSPLWISNLRIIKGTGIYSGATITVPTSPLTAITNTSLLTCQSNRMIDNSSTAVTFTSVGSPQIAGFQPFTPSATSATYGSTYFDGSSYLNFPSGTATSLDLSTGAPNFTIECWIYCTTQFDAANIILQKDFVSGSTNSSYSLYIEGGTIRFYTGVYDGGASNRLIGPTLSLNTWYHVAGVRNGNTQTLYLNGVNVAEMQITVTMTNGSYPLMIGANNGVPYPFRGYMSNVRIVKGTAVYTANFTPSTTPLTAVSGTLALTCQTNQPVNNNVFLDSSSNNFLITRAGNTTQGSLDPFGGNWSNYFDGNGDYLTTNMTGLTFGTGDFTVEFWINPSSTAYSDILDTRITSSGAGSWSVEFDGTNLFWTSNTVNYLNVPVSNFPVGVWTHVAYTRVNAIMKVYVNGTQYGSTAIVSGNYTSSRFDIGALLRGTWYTGYISNLRLVKGSAVYTANFTPSTTPLTAVSGTVLLTCQSNRFVDNSINNLTLTKVGDTSVTRFSAFSPLLSTPTSYSGYFDGTGDYISAAGTNLAFSTGDFTIECWFYRMQSGRIDGIYTAGRSPSASGGFGIKVNSDNKIYWNTNTSYGGPGAATINANQWYHIAITRETGTLKWYINGTLDFTGAGFTQDCTNQFALFGITDDPYYTNMYISNARIVKGTALYTSSFTPSTTPLTTTSQGAIASQVSLLTLQSNTLIDNSTYNYPITAYGDTRLTILNPFGTTNTIDAAYTPANYSGSMYFDGTNDYLIAPLGVASALGNTCTVELWYYPKTSPPTARLINNSTAAGSSLDVYDLSSTIGFANQVATTTTVPLNAWTHIAFVVTSGTLKIYFNGVSQPLSGTSTGINITATGDTWIGGINGYSQWTNGYLSNIRLVKGTALYATNFVPPVAPLQAVTNTTLLLLGSNGAVYDSAMMNNLETVGDAKTSTAVSKFGGSSMYFDGTGDYLQMPSNPSLNFGTNDFTVEAWVNPSALSGDCFIISATGSGGFFVGYSSSTTLGWGWGRNGIAWDYRVASTATTNTWQHLAITRSGTSMRLFVNGVQQGTTQTISTAYNLALTSTTIGSQGSTYYFNGYIDDLRITKGYARYTQNFAVPTAPFPLQ